MLDAAHIVPDRLPEGVPEVRNGLAMCPTHHRAYDQNLLLVTEQHRVEVQRDRLYYAESEATARMLLEFDGREILLSKREHLRPDPEFLRRKLVLAAA
ncbi:HNH endonuclease [Polyangium fumosum]|uniref:HNH endonuclease n=1 Tax=Polyangium fumosum TaxID=889272 RepID=UPI0022B6F385|nr:HNH endonuclease [Polyangium fumosum]